MARQNEGVSHQAAVRVHDGFRERRRPRGSDDHQGVSRPDLFFGRQASGTADSAASGHAKAQGRSHPGHTHTRRRYGASSGEIVIGRRQARQGVLHAFDEITPPIGDPSAEIAYRCAATAGRVPRPERKSTMDGQCPDSCRREPHDKPL